MQTDKGKIIKDENYYFTDIVFLVENCLFRVPRTPFEQHSVVFRDMFQLPVPDGMIPDGLSDEQPLRLDGVKNDSFRQLLKILIPVFGQPLTVHTMPELLVVLKLSVMWQMDRVTNDVIDRITLLSVTTSVNDMIDVLKQSTLLTVPKTRDLAIETLRAKLSSMQKISLGKECRVADWLLDGYTELVERETTITIEEELQLGIFQAMNLYRARDRYHLGRLSSGRATRVEMIIRTVFAIELKAGEYTQGKYVSVKAPDYQRIRF